MRSTAQTAVGPGLRIVLVHAVHEAIGPIHAALARLWPEASAYDLLDSALSADHAADAGRLTTKMRERFLTLGRYAHASGPEGRCTDGILFTCSAFGPAIEAVAETLPVPVVKPNESAFRSALERGPRIGLVVTFEPSLAALGAELTTLSRRMGRPVEIVARVADGAMAALRAGDGQRHDALVAEAARTLTGVDSIVLGQFSTARARTAVNAATGIMPITTPDGAVLQLKSLLDGGGRTGGQ